MKATAESKRVSAPMFFPPFFFTPFSALNQSHIFDGPPKQGLINFFGTVSDYQPLIFNNPLPFPFSPLDSKCNANVSGSQKHEGLLPPFFFFSPFPLFSPTRTKGTQVEFDVKAKMDPNFSSLFSFLLLHLTRIKKSNISFI